MNINEIIETLKQNKIKFKEVQIANILNIAPQTLCRKKRQNESIDYLDIKKIETTFDISLTKDELNILKYAETQDNKYINNLLTNNECTCGEQYNIQYWEGLPDNLKRPKITSIHTDRELIYEDWQLKHDNLRVIPMKGDSLQNYWYPMRHNDILAFDISNKDLNNDGIFVFTTNNRENIYIRKLNLRMDGNIDVLDYKEPTPVIVKTITLEMAKEVDFEIIGRVFKNISLRI